MSRQGATLRPASMILRGFALLSLFAVRVAAFSKISAAGWSSAPTLRRSSVRCLAVLGQATLERDGEGRLMLKALSLKQLQELMLEMGQKEEAAGRLWRWMYSGDSLITGWEQASGGAVKAANCLAVDLCQRLDAVSTLDGGLELERIVVANDGTKKLISRAMCGPAKGKTVESVIIPMVRGPQKSRRYTLCVSSQAGCAMNCGFCHTGRMGLLGNLMASQIVEQLVLARRHLAEAGDPTPIQRMVFMGMGEPLDNYDNVMKALEVLTEQHGKALLGPRKIMVSTVGVVDRMERFLAETQCDLAVSIHATTDEVRDWLVPVNKRWKLSTVMAALHREFGKDPARKRRRNPVAIEYVMLDGVNDSLEDAARLADMVSGMACAVNLINFNSHEGTLFEPSPPERIRAFRAVLRERGILSTHRMSKGDEEMAACGQLGDLSMARRPVSPKPVPETLKEALASSKTS